MPSAKTVQPENTVVVAHFRSRKKANEYGLVILSMGLAYWLQPEEGKYLLCVEAQHEAAVYLQLEKYAGESRFWPPRPVGDSAFEDENWWAIFIPVIILLAFFYAQQHWRGLDNAGILKTVALLREGEWWRPLTALTLHADLTHFAANMLSFVCFILLLQPVFGYGLTLFLILLSGIFGNTLNAWFYYPQDHWSIGSSTAIFGALGMIVAHALYIGFSPGGWRTWKSRSIPLIGGMVILGFLGSSGERTDVMAHVWGFIAGIPLGLFGCWLLARHTLGNASQLGLTVLTAALVLLAWTFALI